MVEDEDRARVVGGVRVKGCFWAVNRFVVVLVVVVRMRKRFTPPCPVELFDESSCTATNLGDERVG